jgi:uncharacterized protein DUF6233
MAERPPSRLELLRFLERVQLQQLQQTKRWLEQEEDRAIRAAHVPPPPPDWKIEMSRGGQHAIAVHAGHCAHGGAPRAKPISREQALAALAAHVEPCTICRPKRDLGTL